VAVGVALSDRDAVTEAVGDGGTHSVPGRYVLAEHATANVKAYAHMLGSDTAVTPVTPSDAHTYVTIAERSRVGLHDWPPVKSCAPSRWPDGHDASASHRQPRYAPSDVEPCSADAYGVKAQV
jgi:hypothetical protein